MTQVYASGILTMFQVTGASNDPVTRYLAFWSLVSALVSLLYGCAFIIQFSRMRKPSIAIEWAFVSHIPSTWWGLTNHRKRRIRVRLFGVWESCCPCPLFGYLGIFHIHSLQHLLSHIRSIVAFLVCIMAFMWRCDANPPLQFLVPPHTELAFRVFVSAVLGVGIFYGMLILTSFQRYGPKMDGALSSRIDLYIASAASPSSIPTQLSPSVSFAQSPTLEKSPGPKSNQRASCSGSPTFVTALGGRSVSLGQHSSTVPHYPSLPNLTSFMQEEQPASFSNVEPLESTDRVVD